VGELLIVEGLHRLALVYVLTQTFCPNLILYYSISNILVFILSQVEAQGMYGINKSLYVKHDIYRFLFLSLAFFAITSITQISSYGFKMLLVFILTIKWHVGSLQKYNENKFTESSWELLGVILTISICEVVFAVYG
jgi:nitrate reductase NapE component